MIQTYEQLHQLIATQLQNYMAQEDTSATFSFESEENGSCTVSNKSNGIKFKFMLAKFGDEYKVGFAMFEGYQPQPVWIDDILSSNFDENFVDTLINEHLV
ncbi:hypothetical protein [Thiomicrorhabdus xiamenensis]|uniref:Uncharacterized protein n=1 Tax=Thiomicrorhabdus xiamenensis TaxID=2739063 RepID=A0A7D4NLA2_9GAMM|nr:hypothetical protein [Thiomicrorhabdus xiamenensis]QKI89989.1 hypothetical protein HQN79_10605 [Thiomicrorhabdus xiamenensis]